MDFLASIFMSVWMAVMSLFGLGTAVVPEISVELPSGTPLNSAPIEALNACLEKSTGDACSIETDEETFLEGICYPSGDTLACGPTN